MESTLQAFTSSQNLAISTKDATTVSQPLTSNCKRHLAPATFVRDMGMPDNHDASNEEYEAHLARQIPLIESTSPTLHDSCIDVEARKATVHLTHRIKLVGIEDEFFVENMILLQFDEVNKIQKIVEFTDAVESKRYMAQVMQVVSSGHLS